MVSSQNKHKGFTLIELIIVIALISLLLFMFSSKPIRHLGEVTNKQVIKDFIVNKMLEVEGYSYNNITVNQELLNGDRSINTDISRFDNGVGTLNNAGSKLAYYHSLYFTTNQNDSIDNTPNIEKNNFIYLLQYRQEGYTNIATRTLETMNFNPTTSPQLIVENGERWSERYRYPIQRPYFLNKIVPGNQDCEDTSGVLTSFQIVYSVASMNFRFFTPLEDNDFDYRLCFSRAPNVFEEDRYFSFRLNRETAKELYFESLK